MEEVISILKRIVNELVEFNKWHKPHKGHWYGTGVKTLSSVITQGNYGSYDKHDFGDLLGYPATWGTIQNHGATSTTGNLYISWYDKNGSVIRAEETRISPNGHFDWVVEDKYEVYAFRVRTDVINCKYQVEAG